MLLDSFLTAYDPSDLPGGSIDPLGFDRGYQLLAGKLLPALTNVANRPRYFSVLCGAISLSDARGSSPRDTPRAKYETRLEAIQRAERFWTLASVLASRDDQELSPGGIRGVSYVVRAADRLDETKETKTDADFRLLSRQVPYGLVGIYASVADELGLIDRGTLSLGPDFGRRLGDAFNNGTEMPEPLRAAIANGGAVGVTTLKAWGKRAHVNVKPGSDEAAILKDALEADPVRVRMAALLAAHPELEDESELLRLERILKSLATTPESSDLRETLRAIIAFERCYRLVMLGFNRILGKCQLQEPFAVELGDTANDDVLKAMLDALPGAFASLDASLDEAQTVRFRQSLERLEDVRSFLRAVSQCTGVASAAAEIVEHHRRVQHSKRAGGRAKMPWIETRNGKVVPTLSSANHISRLPEVPEDVLAHPYRTRAADRFLALGDHRETRQRGVAVSKAD